MNNNDKLIRLCREELDFQSVLSFLTHPEVGGIDIFVGTTRRWTEGVETKLLEYDCYQPLAEREMARLIDAAFDQWVLVRACMIHRLGEVAVGEASVIIGVAAAHRAAAFEACRFLIDTLKTQVPIWKREMLTDGTTLWVEGSSLPEISVIAKKNNPED